MENRNHEERPAQHWSKGRIPIIVIWIAVFLLGGASQLSAKTSSHGSRFNVTFEDISLEQMFKEIESQSEYRFLYCTETVENKTVSIRLRNASIDEILTQALAEAEMEYTLLEKNLVVIKPASTSEEIMQYTVTGKVVSSTDGMPLPGVNVVEKGTNNGTVTDLDGNYSLSITGAESIIVFSFVGYLEQEISVGDQNSIDITLQEDIQSLDEVVVVGYGSMKKSDLTGAVASVSEETLRSSVSANIDQALQGRIAGVQVTQNSGQPGGAASIRIRGANSITGSSEPLYVIDGIPFTGDGTDISGFDWAGGANGQNRVNPLSTINPNDIVSIEVLKDASASAIYGSRAANGVILITTKRGEQGQSKISYNTYYALQTLPKKLEMMDLPQYAEYQLQIADELSRKPDEHYLDISLLGPGTDWQDEVFDNAWVKSHQLSASGGNEKTRYAVSGGYFNQDGIIIGSGFERFSGRINLDSEVKDWLTIGANLSYTRTSEIITLNDGGDGVIMNALLMQPDVPVKDIDGNYAGPSVDYAGVNYNPVALALLRTNNLDRERIMGKVYADFTLYKGLTFNTSLGIDNNNSTNVAYHPRYQFGAISNDLNKMRQQDENSFFWIWLNNLTYNFTVNEKHNFTAQAFYEMQKSAWQGHWVTKENFATDNIPVLSQGEIVDANGWKDGSAMQSVFGRLNYNFDERYLFTGTLRYDGSSNFGPENKWGLFPSASFAWRINNENFMQSLSFIRNMKLRIGYGEVGNQSIGTYLYGSSLLTVNTEFGTGYRMEKISNPELRWESTAQTNIGLDLGLFQGRIDFTVDFYDKQTKDMLLQLSVPSMFGGTTWEDVQAPYVNIGKLQNRGVDLSLTTHNISRGKFSWISTLTFSKNQNKILELDRENSVYYRNLYWYSEFQTATMTKVNEPIGVFYGYQTEGIFENEEEILNHAVQIVDPTTVTEDDPNGTNLVDYTTGVWMGDIKFKDINGDGVINTDDQTIIGDPNPDFTYGFNNTFSYGPFDLTVYLQGAYGGEILNYSRVQIEGMTSPWNNQAESVIDRAQYELINPEGDPDDPANVILANPGTDMPRFATNDNNRNNRMSDRFIEDGSYLRIQNLSFSYLLPREITQRVKMDRLRVYFNIQNLYTFTKYSGYDPEIGAFNQDPLLQNVDMGRYPTPRMYTIGLDVDF